MNIRYLPEQALIMAKPMAEAPARPLKRTAGAFGIQGRSIIDWKTNDGKINSREI